MKLVPNWRSAWKWASVQLAAIASLAIGWIVANPFDLLTLLNGIPYELRVKLSPFVSVAVFVVVVGLRLLKQGRAAK